MATRDEALEIPVDSRRIPGPVVAPATAIPGMLFVQGWGTRGGLQPSSMRVGVVVTAAATEDRTVDVRPNGRV